MYYDKQRRLWRVVFKNDAGKRRTKSFQSEREAEVFEAQLKLGVADTTPSELARVTFSELASRWHREYCKVEKKETRWKPDQRLIEIHLKPAFGDVLARELEPTHLSALKATLRERETGRGGLMKPSSINNVVALAKNIMNWGAGQRIIPPDNPFREVKLLKTDEFDFEWWSLEELETYIKAGRERGECPELLRLVEFSLHTGVRFGEAMALKRKNLAFDRNKIRIVASHCIRLGKDLPTKNNMLAEIPMNAVVRSILEPKRFLRPDQYVFDRSVFVNLRARFRASAEKSGVKVIRWHDLRHSFASNLAVAGVDGQRIQKLMRHKTFRMTQRYMRLRPEHLKGSTEVLCTQAAHKKAVGMETPTN